MLDLAYRILGSVVDAEDAVQESYARLVVADPKDIRDVRGWLVTVTSRVCLDKLRSACERRRAYVGPWLPEPIVDVGQGGNDPADRVTLDDSIRMAVLVVLERLTPAERTAFVLHDVFKLPFDEIASIVGRPVEACRQLASRARRRVRSDRAAARFSVDPAEHRRVTTSFARACESGDLEGLLAILHPDVEGEFDSGGFVPGAPTEPARGAAEVSGILARSFDGAGASFEVVRVNGEPGVVVTRGGRIVAVIALGLHDGLIDHLLAIGNPNKLAHLTTL